MMIWLLRDYPLTPTFQGGSIKKVLPNLRLIEGPQPEGPVHLRRAAKPGVASTVAQLYKGLPME